MLRRRNSPARSRYASKTTKANRKVIELLEARRLLAASGSLDASFNGTGMVGLDFQSTAVAVQTDGKTVVVGTLGNDVAVARFNVDGTIDTSFGPTHTGEVVNDLGGVSCRPEAVAVQGDGKIIIAGTRVNDSGLFSSSISDALVARYDANGTLDTSFDGDGKVIIDFGTGKEDTELHAMILQSDGKIVVAGESFQTFGSWDFAVARLNTNGSLDGSFDDDGVKTIDFGADEYAYGLAIDNSNKIIAVGRKDNDDGLTSSFAIARMNPGGGLDGSFDGDGKVVTSFPAIKSASPSSVVTEGDKIVVAGSVNGAPNTLGGDFAIVRYLNNGALDTSFGTSGGTGPGFTIVNVATGDRPVSLVRSTDGKFVVAGPSGSGSAILKFADNGLLDGTFASNGIAKTSLKIAQLVAGPGKRFMTADGKTAARFLDSDANVVRVVSLDATASEAGQDPASLFVFRSERLPFATGVFLTVSGTATSPLPSGLPIHPKADYTGVSAPPPNGIIYFNTAYALIPANETFTTITITPVDDAIVEGGETAVFTVQPNAAYDVGSPSSTTLTIKDNEGGSISGRVFNDLNGDGAKDVPEPGLANRTVYIDANNNSTFDSGERSAMTDALGFYRLGGLVPGSYKVRQVIPSGWTQTAPAGGAGITVNLALGQDLTIDDFGTKTVTGSISGTVFNDANGNGVRDSGEGIFAGITIYSDTNNNKILDSGEPSTATDTSGNYTLSNLNAGNYIIRQKLPSASYLQTFPSGGFGIHITLAQGQNALNQNFGDKIVVAAMQQASIAGKVFNDANGNGHLDAGEAGISGRTVWIDLDNDKVKDSTEPTVTTDSSGNYKFSNLAAGTYTVREVVPAGWMQTLPTGGNGVVATVSSSQNLTGQNFGTKQTAVASASIAGNVFHDFNRNGIKNTGDSNLSGWTVWIDLDNDKVKDANEKSAVTDANGNYTIAGLAAGSYIVRVKLQSGWVQTRPSGGFGIHATVSTAQKLTGQNFGVDN